MGIAFVAMLNFNQQFSVESCCDFEIKHEQGGLNRLLPSMEVQIYICQLKWIKGVVGVSFLNV